MLSYPPEPQAKVMFIDIIKNLDSNLKFINKLHTPKYTQKKSRKFFIYKCKHNFY